MAMSDETGSRPYDPGDVHYQSVAGGGRGRMTYAEKAGGAIAKKKKLNVLDIILERRNPEISFTMSKLTPLPLEKFMWR